MALSEEKGFMDITKVFALIIVIVAWKADNSGILYSFSGIGCAVLVLSDKDF